jgi:hypothetical protein
VTITTTTANTSFCAAAAAILGGTNRRMIPDALLQGFNHKSSSLSGEPSHIGSVVHRSSSQHEAGLIPQLFDLYRMFHREGSRRREPHT